MARKATTLVASALLLLLAVAFLSHDAGVEAWCVQYPAPGPNACRGSRHLPNCRQACAAVGHGFAGKCNTNGDCLCVKCADEPSAAPARAL